jgi:hypothetical protein
MYDVGWAEPVSGSSRTLESECNITDRRVAVTARVGENEGCSARVFLTNHVPFNFYEITFILLCISVGIM